MFEGRTERALQEAWAMVALISGAGAIGVLAGMLLDRLLGTHPWLLAMGAFAGFATGLYLAIHYGVAFAHREERRR